MKSIFPKPLYLYAREIEADWKSISVHAKPYVDAMHLLNSINDTYGYDDARDIVLRFLGNASGWRGEKAKAVKQELKEMLKR